ncbi:alpha/beta fold hydrolase [Sphingomonas daechungensis]|uniref:alpha/beta fold hydrolase n=1 Tax=Sphingomonas daechungensis TaxID=1176646 RepID=UPI003782F2DC
MELSVLPCLDTSNAQEVTSEGRGPSTSRPLLTVFDVPVPPDLRRFGDTVRASALGNPSNPPIVVLGGISANGFPSLTPEGSAGWWSNLIGQGQSIDPRSFYIVGVDFAADDSGTSAPTTAEQARVLAAALDAIGIDRPAAILGASYGAMVGLALAEAEPDRVSRLVIVSAAERPHPASTAARELQRRVVALGQAAGCGEEALSIARGLAMLTYRTPAEFRERFEGGIADDGVLSGSAPGAYLRSRGQAFCSVMCPGRFLSLSASIDRHDVDPTKIQVPCLIIGAESDQLVFAEQLRTLAERLGDLAQLHLLDSLYGHDMFLKEAERVGSLIAPFVAGEK